MPWIELERAANVRGLGGLVTQDGGATRWLAGHGFGRADLDRLHAKLRRP